MDLRVNAAFSKGDPEGSVVAPGLVPGVHAEPVVSSPSNNLNGVTTELATSLVSVHSGFVGQKVLIDGKGGGYGPVFVDIAFDSFLGSKTVA